MTVAMTSRETMSKVPVVTLAFWVAKIAATTLGETGGDAVSMSLNLGYALSTVIFAGVFLIALGAQLATTAYHPVSYWFVIVATTTVGTTMSDYCDRTLGLGYSVSSAVLLSSVVLVLVVWRLVTGSISVARITDRRSEIFYWTTILFSNTLGTALGDWLSDTQGFGFGGSALVFGGLIGLVAAAYFVTKIPHALLFWAAFVLTRPLGATLGDLLTKAHEQGGLHLDRISSSLVLAVLMIGCIAFTGLRKSPEKTPSR